MGICECWATSVSGEREEETANNMKENLNKNMFKAIWMINVCDISIHLEFFFERACGDSLSYVRPEKGFQRARNTEHAHSALWWKTVVKNTNMMIVPVTPEALAHPLITNKINSSNLLNLCGDFEWFLSFSFTRSSHQTIHHFFRCCQKQFRIRYQQRRHTTR